MIIFLVECRSEVLQEVGGPFLGFLILDFYLFADKKLLLCLLLSQGFALSICEQFGLVKLYL